MPGIKVRENEGFDSAMRRFKRVVEKSGLLSEMRKREYHETPSEQKKRALAAAIKRFRKKQMRESRGERGSRGSRGGSTSSTSSSTGSSRGGSSSSSSGTGGRGGRS